MICIHVQLLGSVKNMCLTLLEKPVGSRGNSNTGLFKVRREGTVNWAGSKGRDGAAQRSRRGSLPTSPLLSSPTSPHLPPQRSERFTLNLLPSGMLRQFFKSILASVQAGGREQRSPLKDLFICSVGTKWWYKAKKKKAIKLSIQTAGSLLQTLNGEGCLGTMLLPSQPHAARDFSLVKGNGETRSGSPCPSPPCCGGGTD